MSCTALLLVCLVGLSGCFGQERFLTVEVVPLSTTSVQASFIPPEAGQTYMVFYRFGDGPVMSQDVMPPTANITFSVNLTDATASPGALVQVQVNSSLDFIYPTTQARTCYSVPPAPGGIASFIDSVGFMSTTWNSAGDDSGVTQYNLQYRVVDSIDTNEVAVPATMREANVSSLRVQILYEVRLQSCLAATCEASQGDFSDWVNALATPNFGPLCSTSPAVGAASFATVLLMLVCALVIRLVA